MCVHKVGEVPEEDGKRASVSGTRATGSWESAWSSLSQAFPSLTCLPRPIAPPPVQPDLHTPGLGQDTHPAHQSRPLCPPDFIPPKPFPTCWPSHLCILSSTLTCSVHARQDWCTDITEAKEKYPEGLHYADFKTTTTNLIKEFKQFKEETMKQLMRFLKRA